MKKLLLPSTLFCFFLLCSNMVFAQQPAFFMLGQDQFSGVQVYNVIQDKNLNYWFATNDGLYVYDYYTFQKVKCEKAKSNSMFNFVMNSEGVIYCHNLNRQIFKIENNICEVLYELKSDEESADVSLSITDDDKLLVRTRKLIVLNKQGEVTAKFSENTRYLSEAFTTHNSGTHIQIDSKDTLIVYSKGKFMKHRLKKNGLKGQQPNLLKFFAINNISYAIDIKSKQQFIYNTADFELTAMASNPAFERSKSIRIYETGNEIWVAGTLPGATLLNEKNIGTNSTVFYQNYFVSDVFKDNEGNILISTFDKGVIVVPDLEVPDVTFSLTDDPAVSMLSAGQQGLFLGTSKGHLINFQNNRLLRVDTSGNRRIEGVYGHHNSPLIVFDNGGVYARNKISGEILRISEASLKDAKFVSENIFYLGTNGGILRCVWDGKHHISAYLLRNARYRIYALAYNPTDSILYAATSNGLMYAKDTTFLPILYNSTALFPNLLEYYNGKVYANHKTNNLLVIKGNKITDSITPLVAGKAEALNKFVFHNNTIIGRSSNGLFLFDMNGRLLKYLHSKFGFTSHKVQDFVMHNNKLWVSHTGGVQQIDLSKESVTIPKYAVRVTNLFVNNEPVKFAEVSAFNHKQNKFEFTISYPTLKNREGIHYLYQLAGFENKWNSNSYELNKITYNALPPGNYTLNIKTENQNSVSKPVAYPFSISRAFYNTWWFITLSIIIFLLIVYIIYRWQLQSQRKKSELQNELSASKLSAIQSQMNPHFIFNALNSIQDLVLKGDVENSYSYITTFSDLVRRTLNYSQKEFIEFDQEVKLLHLYLSLEKLRFKKNFSFDIEDINLEGILIPPMLIQPFIENSLAHGLLHKVGEKKLSVRFELKEHLICTIDDNGVGREMSKSIKTRQNATHESFSGKAIGRRLEILSKVLEGEFGYTYEDLYDKDGAIGTRVILHIPFKRTF